MAINVSGVSTAGAQTLGVFVNATRYIVAFDTNLPPIPDFRRRLGLLIVAQLLPDGRFRLIDLKKVFSSGLLWEPPSPGLNLQIGILVDWYHPGVPWQLQTFDL